MFTGIIECTGKILSVNNNGTNKTFTITAPIVHELKIDQSVSHNGVCLTVESIKNDEYTVTAIDETLKKTNLGNWQAGHEINLERCMLMNGRLDGHIVQGHVDTTAVCTDKKSVSGSWEFTFKFNESFAALIIEKGSISVNGTSLTIFNVTKDTFTVAIIPYTYEHTNIKYVEVGSTVNIEFDIIGKYLARMASLK